MSWAKRNLYFLISCIVAVALLGAAGWYCYSELQLNSKNWDDLTKAYDELKQITDKQPNAGGGSVDNIKTAREQTKDAKERAVTLRKFFAPVPSIPNTNRIDDRALAGAVRDTIRQMRMVADANHVGLPADFAFSFSAQRDKAVYAPRSGEQLAKQLGEVKAICDVIFSSRVISLEGLQRERTADDAGASALDYLDLVSVTNNNTIVTPYQVVFRCFTPELAGVLSGFANQPFSMAVKTLNIEPADATLDTTGAAVPPQATGTTTGLPMAGGLPVIVDEKKLKVTMLVEFVKLQPPQNK